MYICVKQIGFLRECWYRLYLKCIGDAMMILSAYEGFMLLYHSRFSLNRNFYLVSWILKQINTSWNEIALIQWRIKRLTLFCIVFRPYVYLNDYQITIYRDVTTEK